MRILVVQSGSFDQDGNPKYSITSKRQIDTLIQSGHSVEIFLVTSRTSPLRVFSNIIKLRKKVKLYKPEIIHAHYGAMVGFVASTASKSSPFIVSICGDDILGTVNSGIIWRIRERISHYLSLIASLSTNAIIVKSLNIMQALPRFLDKKVKIIPNGVDIEFFKELSELERKELRHLLGWDNKFVIFFNGSSGNNEKVKNLALANEVVELIHKKFPNVSLFISGQQDPESFRDSLAASDCLLVTSLHEGSPNVVKEAMSCNVPVVSVDCGDVSTRLKNVNKGGVYSFDSQELSNSIISVMGQKDITYNGRKELIDQGLDSTAIVYELTNLYNNVISN